MALRVARFLRFKDPIGGDDDDITDAADTYEQLLRSVITLIQISN
jgi:hypothetical protein